MKKREGRKSQITIFIILGLIILLALAFFIYLREKSFYRVDRVDEEFIPVKSYVETCMYNLGKEGLDLLGLNGGYIYFPPDISNNPNSYLSVSPIPEIKNPYWWYDGISSIPSEDFMEGQLSQYVKEKLPDCLNKFAAFSNVYDIVEHSNIQIITELGESMDSNVNIKSLYSIEIKDKYNKTLAEITNFDATIPVRLHAVYSLAKSIMDVENAQGFIERKVMDLITMDEEIPDTGGPEFTCKKLTWNINDIEQRLRWLMAHNFDYIKIKGTEFPADRYLPLPDYDKETKQEIPDSFNASYYWTHYIWDVGDLNWSDMRTSFSYDYNWDLRWQNDLYIRPNKYPLLYSNSQKGYEMLSYFCMHIWHFTYDIKFPVKVTITDERSKKSEPYSFTFAFKGSIDHNEPRRESFTSTDYAGNELVNDEEFCSNAINHVIIFAKENTSAGWEINNVNLSMVCGRFDCPLGMTRPYYATGTGGTPFWEGMVPSCSLAVIRAKKQGYADAETFAQMDRKESLHYIYMDPTKEFKNFTIVKHQLMGSSASPLSQELSDDESAIIILKAREKKYEKTIQYSKNASMAEAGESLTLLADDAYTYDLEIYVMNQENIIGGYKAEWKPDQGDLDKATTVKFHTIYQYSSDDTQTAMFFMGLDTYSNLVSKPELLR